MNTGTAPYCIIGATVVGNPQATVMISSPRDIARSPNNGDVRAMNANKFADDPELTKLKYGTPRYSDIDDSNSSVYLPEVSQNSKDASTRFTISS